jgi:TRAP-type mannitol/chloroaromatic compound transport system permease small subunit
MIARLDRMLGATMGAMQWLVLPLVLLLFLQWPLRDLVRCCSREANDLGQIFFALFVAASITAATRAGTHLAADALAQHYSPRIRHMLRKAGALFGLVPWAAFVLVASKPTVLSSVAAFEAFPDTANPGYFLIKLAVWVMALIVLAQTLVVVAQPIPQDDV